MTFVWLDFIVMVHSCKSRLSLTVNSVSFCFVTLQTDLLGTSGSCFLEENVGLWEYEERFSGTVTENTAWAY
jgi:hypothetical protein